MITGVRGDRVVGMETAVQFALAFSSRLVHLTDGFYFPVEFTDSLICFLLIPQRFF